MSYNPSFNTFTNPTFTSNQYPNRNGILWVQGDAGAKSFIVGAGQTVLLMDSEADKFYIKSADMSGMPSMRTFEYSEIMPVNASKNDFTPELDKYLTKDEFYAEMAKLSKKGAKKDE